MNYESGNQNMMEMLKQTNKKSLNGIEMSLGETRIISIPTQVREAEMELLRTAVNFQPELYKRIVCKKDNWWEKENYGNCTLIYLDEKGKAEFCDLPVKTEPYIGGNADFTLSFETKYGDGNDDGTRKLYCIDKKKLGSNDCASEVYTLKD